MSKFVTLALEPRFNDEYGEYANLPVFNAHGDVVGYTGGEVPEAGNPCEFCIMDDEGFPACHSASENAKLRELVRDYEHCTMHADCSRCEHNGKLSMHCPLSPCFPDSDELRKLGVEVN